MVVYIYIANIFLGTLVIVFVVYDWKYSFLRILFFNIAVINILVVWLAILYLTINF